MAPAPATPLAKVGGEERPVSFGGVLALMKMYRSPEWPNWTSYP